MLFLAVSCRERTAVESFKTVISLKILDNNFEMVKEITDESELAGLKSAIQLGEPVKVPDNPEWEYKLDIETEKENQRWLYNKKGYLAKLNYQLRPCYKISEPEWFIKLVKK